jgi:integrase
MAKKKKKKAQRKVVRRKPLRTKLEKRPLIRDLLDMWEKKRESDNQKTLESQKSFIKWLREYFWDDYLDQLNFQTSEQLVHARKTEYGNDINTIRLYLQEFVQMLNWALASKLVYDIPWIEIPPLRPNNIAQEIPESLVKEILAEANDKYRSFFEFLYHCPRRANEVTSLRWDQIFLSPPENRRIKWKTSKNKEPIEMPLIGPALEVILERLKTRKRGCAWVWYHIKHKGEFAPFGNQTYMIEWRRIRKKLGFEREGYRVHDFRCTWITSARRAGVPREAIMAASGHRTETVFTRYSVANSQDAKAAFEGLYEARESADE